MNVRNILASLAIAALAISVTASGEVGKTYVIRKSDGTDVPVVCSGDRTVEAVEVEPSEPFSYIWDPTCSSLESGQYVTFLVRAPGDIHDPWSELDGGQCFAASAAPPRGMSAFIDSSPDRRFHVQFKYEGGVASARTVTFNPDGTTSFGYWHACPGALDLRQTTVAEAVIPYLCTLHPNMQGLIVIESSGTIGVS